MRTLLTVALLGVVVWIGTSVLAQPATRPGFHVIALPKGSTGAQSVKSTVLLETPHLKLVSITVPKGGMLANHADPAQVSIQALAGSGEVRMSEGSERIDSTRAIVLAPGVAHEVRASTDSDLVLLVHHMLACGRGMGPPEGRGAHRGMGPGPMGPGSFRDGGPGMTPRSSPSSGTAP